MTRLIFVFLFISTQSCTHKPDIVLRAQTDQEEFNSIINIAKDLPWYNRNGYQISLPSHDAFHPFYKMFGNISELETEKLRTVFKSEIYKPKDYTVGISRVESQRSIIEKAWLKMKTLNSNWGFKLQPRYLVLLSLYGSGGSYDSKNSVITMLVRPDGTFRRPKPEHTIIHEMIHIGIEDIIVKKFSLEHWEKEHLVDLICYLYFSEELPDYQIQSRGNNKMGAYVTLDHIKQDLPSAIRSYKNSKN